MAPGNDFHTFRRHKEVIRDPDVSLHDAGSVLEAAVRHQADLVDVAQDDALAAGAIDLLKEHGIPAFGPTRSASQIEWDKAWARGAMGRYGIPSPSHRTFSQESRLEAARHLRELYDETEKRLVYIKATKLCGGKGALPARSYEQAGARISELRELGPAGDAFVIEDGLTGEEFSYYVISDGKTFRTFPSAQDNKLSHDNDTGRQTGGMGAVSPTSLTDEYVPEIDGRLIEPALDGLRAESRPYQGLLYLGGIITPDGLNTIEFNARWGDPEVQAILPGLEGDYHAIVQSALDEDIARAEFGQDGLTRVCIVGASKGYPDDYSVVTGREIRGLERAARVPGVTVYGAAVAVEDGRFYAAGGRLFNVVGEGRDVAEAQDRAYEAMQYVSVQNDGLHYRTDIGNKERMRRA